MELVQPILIATSGDHVVTVSCAARASVLAYVQPIMAGEPVAPEWETWLGVGKSAMPTTVRAAGQGDLEAAGRWAEEKQVNHLLIKDGTNAALALAPVQSSGIPAVVDQVSEADDDLARSDQPAPVSTATVRVEVAASLTTSRAAAQAARALWAWAVPQLIDAPEPLAEWARTGGVIDLAVVDALDTRDGAFIVRDQDEPTAVAIPGRLLKSV
ncbi:hypothetical protein [Georgenia yuyongxinii]|uniref:Uncharacterized protein n=1 Tax=Georgenia yuyongxinii TaxID=2589797 RepID=A0A552WU52_9MICO|nr:hypothetical protein [Georgenia yuyongxinii]TRW46380.1 hypothetical protein FJ693_05490 [Georgenia yuyongxinii]